ncbi:uncharacterized protein VTP21DRAFT_3837 [Calcarisporiella thermophila]|uniref:uncharacterized protein n=1 Tax=Calcarisporiella thermophila TaxID=911321 RepID=UPI003743BE4B
MALFRSIFEDFRLSPLPIDILETTNEFVITTEIPGVSGNDIHLSTAENTLTIRAERKEKHDEKDRRISERWYGSVSRSIRLPSNVKSEKITAELKDGVLTVIVPKGEASGTKHIKIEEKAKL